MLEYQGKYGKATVMLDEIEGNIVTQIYSFINHEAFNTDQIRLMSDIQIGAGCVVGLTMPILDNIIPNIVGVDINCGMLSLIIKPDTFPEYLTKDQRIKMDETIRKNIPFGTSVHTDVVNIEERFWKNASIAHREFILKYNNKYKTNYSPIVFNMEWFVNKCEQIGIDTRRAIQSIGSLGSGNHFIELGKLEKSKLYVFTIHSGSRQFGLKICKYWQKKAGKGSLAYLQGDDMFGYLSDTVFAQMYASLNRDHMADLLINSIGLNPGHVVNSVQTNHNFIDFDDFIIRKGAVRSYKGERLVIPLNMQDGILLCEGKSNPDWNFSAPHGAGRPDSRRWAKENLDIDEARENMEQNDIYCSKLPLDETKGAYKDPNIIINAIGPTVDIIDTIKPVLAMKDD